MPNVAELLLAVPLSMELDPETGGYKLVVSSEVPAFSGAGAYFGLPVYETGSGTNRALDGDVVRGYRFYLPFKLTVARIAYNVETAEAGTLGGVGIYNRDGDELLLESGAFSLAVTGIAEITLPTPVVLAAGFYLFCFTGNSVTGGLRADAVSSGTVGITNVDGKQSFSAANAGTNGVFPATLGALSGVDNLAIPMIGLMG